MQESLDTQALAEENRLGELLISVGLLERNALKEALQICDQTGLGIGRVLVLSQHINEKMLDATVQCQTLLKNHRMDLPTVRELLNGIATGKYKSMEQALGDLGQTPEEPAAKLGDLLIEAGLVSKQQLAAALAQSEETGLPFGRLLVLSGVITEQIMTTAVNAQSALSAKKATLEQAVKSLRSSGVRRTGVNVSGPSERDFYQLPDRKSVLLGELLVAAGSISKAQLSNAIEMSVSNAKSLGQVLQELHLISEVVLKHTLELQDMVMSNKCSTADAAKIIQLVDHDKLPMEVALQRVRLTAQIGPDKKVSFLEFLKLLGVVDDDAVNKAFNMGRENAHVLLNLLMFAKVCDPNFLHLAASCNAMMESGRLTVEHAFVLFDYARKKKINVEQALKELNWGQGDISAAITSANAGQEWEMLRRHAEQALQEGQLEQAEKQWLDVVKKAEALGGREGPRFVSSIERLADVYTKQSKYAQAESLYSEALVTKTRVLPPHSLHTAASVNNMAKISYFQGKFDDAERFALRFLELYKANFPSNHPDVACALQNVATLYHMQERYHLAEPYYTEAIRICKAELGDNHATTVRMNQNYARLLQQMKRFREADKVDARVQGSVTGSWKAVSVPSDHLLYNLGEKGKDE